MERTDPEDPGPAPVIPDPENPATRSNSNPQNQLALIAIIMEPASSSSSSAVADLPQVLPRSEQPAENDPSSQPPLPDEQKVSKNFLEVIPEDVFIKIFEAMSIDELKKSRLVCSTWNNIITESTELFPSRTCFFFDGRKDDNGLKCSTYFATFETGCSLWNTIRVRSSSSRHITWIDLKRTTTVTHFEFHNCSLHWSTVVKVLMEFENLTSLQDIQDMYCWDYAMFNEGIAEDQSILNTNEYPLFVETGRLDQLSNLRNIKIHRSNIRDCTTYLKILELRCGSLESIEITTDCNFPQGRSARMYTALGNLLLKNSRNLLSLRFPFKNIYSQYDFRLTEDQRPFRDFLAFMGQENWTGRIEMEALTDLHLSFPMIVMDQDEFELKLKPFLYKQNSLKKLRMSSVNLEPGKEEILLGLTENPNLLRDPGILPQNQMLIQNQLTSTSQNPFFQCEFDVYINDGRNIPELGSLLDFIASLSVQTWRITGTEVKNVLPLLREHDRDLAPLFRTESEAGSIGVNGGDGGFTDFRKTKELQYFSKSHTFRNFNIDLLCLSFSKLTHLNLVDHNTRVEHRHSSEAVAAIEDEHFQIILKKLGCLRSLQIIANMTYLTDSGLTGIKGEAVKRMLRHSSFVKMDIDLVGVPVANLKYLKTLVLRGVGIKVTDVSVHFAFGSMEVLKKIHIFGSQQTSPAARTAFHEKFPNFKGYDLEI